MEIVTNLRKKLIISVDDFGLSQEATKNILALAKAGKVDRVAVLVDHLADDQNLAELVSTGIKIDLHLRLKNFDENMKGTKSVVRRSALFLWHHFSQKDSLEKVEVQWLSQIEKFIRLSRKMPDGLNSHQYIHFFPSYFKIFLRIAEKYKIPYLRFGKKGIVKNSSAISRILSRLWEKNNPQFKKFYFDSSDFLASFDWINSAKSANGGPAEREFDRVKNFPLFLEKLPLGKTELVFHPEREDEFEILDKYF